MLRAEIIYFRLRLHLCPSPALAIYCHLKLYNNSSVIRNMIQWRFIFILASTKPTAVSIKKDNFSSGSKYQVSAPQTPQHRFFHLTLQLLFVSLVKCFVSRDFAKPGAFESLENFVRKKLECQPLL